MQTPYKAEFFDRSFLFKCFYPISLPEIKMDYMTLDKTTIVIANLPELSRGWYCQITRGKDIAYQGVISSVSQSENATTVLLSPLQSLFGTQMFKKKSSYSKQNLEGWIAGLLTEYFIQSGDSVQNIPGLSVSCHTRTDGVAIKLDNDIFNFWTDIAKQAIEKARIVIFCSFDVMTRTLNADIRSFPDASTLTIEADLPNIEKQNFTIRDGYGSVNKVVLINNDNTSQKLSVTSDSYTVPTVCQIEKITVGQNQTFENAARERAAEIMKKEDFENLIELQIRANDMIVPDMSIGQPCRIIKNGTVYNTVLTGTVLSEGLRTLIFGGIRIELTKILKGKGVI